MNTLDLINKHIGEQQAAKDSLISFDRLEEMIRRQYTEMAEHAGRIEDATPLAEGEASKREAAMGRILLKYIDRLTDPVPEDSLEKIVKELDHDVHALWSAEQDALRAMNQVRP